MSEHGWNDPPPLPYKNLQSSSGQKRNQLNKRPCYPADSVPVSAHHRPPPGSLAMPPPGTGSSLRSAEAPAVANPPRSTGTEVSKSSADDGISSCSQLVDSLGRLTEDLITSGAIEKQTADEIRKRLDIFSIQWNDGSLSKAVQSEVTLLTQALVEHNYPKADSIQVSLMADHVTEVNQWLPGIKKLITLLQQKP